MDQNPFLNFLVGASGGFFDNNVTEQKIPDYAGKNEFFFSLR